MNERSETTPPADEGRLDGRVRVHDPERAAFEAFCRKRWAGDRGALTIREDGEYQHGHVHFAWAAWQEARPPRHEIGRLVNLAAQCAQRKPLLALEPLTEASHIGHRQFARAYAGADEAVRLLAIELRRVADAL